MSEEAVFYDQDKLWGNAPEPYQLHLRADILSILPDDARSILDVGCGDGFVTNALPADRRVVGMDISPQALKHVKWPTLLGSATELPFEDGAFDLVMATDVIEHLPPGQYERCLAEIARVARRYVLLAVPHREQLQATEARCAACGRIYHLNWHHRRFEETTLRDLMAPRLRLLELRFSGADTRPPWDSLIGLAQALDQYRVWSGGKCPDCGSSAQVDTQQTLCRRALESCRGSAWGEALRRGETWNDRSELLALYAVAEVALTQMATHPATPPAHIGSPLDIDFSNALQTVEGGFTAGARWARFIGHPGLEIGRAGIRRRGDGPAVGIVEMRLPAAPREGDRLVVRASADGAGSTLVLYGIDGITLARRELLHQPVTAADQAFDVGVGPAWWPGPHGLAIEAHLRGGVVLHALRYESGGAASVNFVRLRQGHNVVPLEGRDYAASWGFLAATEGLYPQPACPVHESEPQPRVSPVDLRQAVTRMEQAASTLASEKVRLLERLETQEQSRAAAENAYAAARAEADEHAAQARLMTARLEKQEQELALALAAREEALQALDQTQWELQQRIGLRGAVREIARWGKRRVAGPYLETLNETYPPPWRTLVQVPPAEAGKLKVLVISYMFPHPDQPWAGCFVLEQVRALREQGIDARVLSGRPFWMHGTHGNPLFLARKNRQYWRFHQERQWMELQGVPVLYLPYRVMFGFWFHGWSYQQAMCRNIEAIRRQFPFDLVHAHSGYMDGCAGSAIARRFNVPLVITEHTGPFSNLMNDRHVRRQTLRSLEQARRIIAVSRAQQADVSRHLAPPARQRGIVVHNGVDLREFYPPQTWRPSPQSPRLFFVGGLDDVKNLPLLFQAFAQVVAQVPGATLTLIGEGSQTQELAAEAKRLNLGEHVSFRGRMDRAGVAQALRDDCDLLVLSSRSETFGCVVIEALASGKPVVSTRCGGPEDILTEPFLGRLCRNHDAEDLARTLLDVIQQIDTFSPQLIRRHVEERFGYDTIARQIAGVYQEVLRP